MDDIEKRIIQLIDDNRENIITFAEEIEDHPEPGYQEVRTAARTAEFLRELGYQVEEGLALTGVKGEWQKEDQILQ